ncbi:LysR substrate-binding domain-containing protein [uncultured Cohaesibacter sp.]|uniref:LysR substrate-binding domain-containing protein n=1 Tax=uncultured Cohaesibacter sp. TaxID=1002546 RepID=UPI0029C69D2A|nr:LysR substrate-binding domain-containing protein [uncultured Cohaesibacter sp.]
MDFIRQIGVFVTVAEQGSFARAAEALHMTRPAVSNAISDLEKSLGARLLHRTTRRTLLSGEGNMFLEHARGLLKDVERTRNLFGGTADQPRGRLRVEIPVALALPIIIPNLPQFSTRYPDIELMLGVSDQPADLLAEGIDCTLRIGPPPTGRLVGRTIGYIRLVTCASPAYLKAHGTPVKIDDLHHHSSVAYFSGRDRRIQPWLLCEDGEIRSVTVPSSIHVNDTAAFVACAVAGYGLIQATRPSILAQLRSGDLVEVLAGQQAKGRQISVLYPARDHLAPQVRAFIDWMIDLFRNTEDQLIGRP